MQRFTRKIEKHFQRPSPKDRIIDSRPWCGKSASSRSRWETTDRWISKPWRISLSFRIGANSQQKIVHFGEQRKPSNVNYIFVLRTVFRTKRTDTVELAWTDTREYSTLEDNLDFRRGQRISGELRSILSRWYALQLLLPTLSTCKITFHFPGKGKKERKKPWWDNKGIGREWREERRNCSRISV